MGRILREECPDASITLSSELIPVIFEFERTSTAVVNAYLEPIVRRYMDQLSKEFRDERYGGEILVMQSSGGVTTPEGAGRNAARTIMSGPAAGVIAAKALGQLAGVRNIISLDMGGTSADIATIFEGGDPLDRGVEDRFRHSRGVSLDRSHHHPAPVAAPSPGSTKEVC